MGVIRRLHSVTVAVQVCRRMSQDGAHDVKCAALSAPLGGLDHRSRRRDDVSETRLVDWLGVRHGRGGQGGGSASCVQGRKALLPAPAHAPTRKSSAPAANVQVYSLANFFNFRLTRAAMIKKSLPAWRLTSRLPMLKSWRSQLRAPGALPEGGTNDHRHGQRSHRHPPHRKDA